MENVRLNHFILWCKGWYEAINEDEGIFESALRALKLDGYICANTSNVNGIALNFIDDMIDRGVVNGHTNGLRMLNWNNTILDYMHLFEVDYNTALLYTIKNFFAHTITKEHIKLQPPSYSRKLFKMGFVAPSILGNSYKMQNHKTQRYFRE